MVEHLTLDTNVLRDWAWAEARSCEVRFAQDPRKRAELRRVYRTLRSLRDQEFCDLAVTTQLYTDYQGIAESVPKAIVELIGDYTDLATPSISTFPVVFPIVFPDRDILDNILNCVFPGSGPFAHTRDKRRKDTLQLHAHFVTGRDRFLTSDEAILRASVSLRERHGILVERPSSYVERVLQTLGDLLLGQPGDD